MLDFLTPSRKDTKKGIIIFPDYKVGKVDDLMIKGGRFYAIWDQDKNMWSTNFQRAVHLIDRELDKYADEIRETTDVPVHVMRLSISSNKTIDSFKHYIEKQMTDSFVPLDKNLTFSNDIPKREDYVSKSLPYPLVQGRYDAYDELMSTLYSDNERRKIEWAIGAVITGDSKYIQKFLVFVGDAGTGKSTVIKIISKLFSGYTATINAGALGSSNSAFALEPLKDNPLVALEDDSELDKIEKNTRLNSLVSHETLLVNEKFKSVYPMSFDCFIFLGSNKEVRITDARSGLLRRLIDVEPTGETVPENRYFELMNQIDFELSGIAWHCKEVYLSGKHDYDKYFPTKMIGATNHMYNFVEENYYILLEDDKVSLAKAWDLYKKYCNEAAVPYPLSKQNFKTELRAYFYEFSQDGHLADGTHYRNLYSGFKYSKLGLDTKNEEETNYISWLSLEETKSIFDEVCSDMPAQYATGDGIPSSKWDGCKTILSDLDTSKLHYVKVPENHIVIDFDLKDENGEKSFELNIAAAKKWPKTYAEVSKSGSGIHLHYIYDGDVNKLSRLYSEGIEVKVFNGNSSLRRCLTLCNNIPIVTISSGLPLKKGDKMLNITLYKNEKAIRTLVEKNLRKDYHPGTKPSVDFIYDILEEAYESGIDYDISDMRPAILAFASNSSNHAEYCVTKVAQMHFYQDKDTAFEKNNKEFDKDLPIVFYDVEVFKNLFIIVYKYQGAETCVRLINPSPEDVQKLFSFKLVGFNNRRYDNHILYGRSQGYSLEQLYNLSQRIINKSKNAMFAGAYNLSYTDVYDFSSSQNKRGLKKWQILLDIHHQELGIPWDEEVPEELWELATDYCENDVRSTEVVFNHLSSDWAARQILAELSGLTVNDSTNQHSTKIIFGNNKHPQDQFLYRDLSKPVTYLDPAVKEFLEEEFPYMMKWWKENTDSLLPYFPGYEFKNGKSTYLGEEAGEGGYVSAIHGMYGGVALDDVESMHPHSALAECLFGPLYSRRYMDLLRARLYIKHGEFEMMKDILDGKLVKYVDMILKGELSADDLSTALKTVINSIYGLTDTPYENAFRDPRNKDNIVAKRGALFMILLEKEVTKKGYQVVHVKTDSIKIPNADNYILEFVSEFGKRYGYNFDHEATYDRMTLVNDSTYIARYSSAETCEKLYGYIPKKNKKSPNEWTATGAQFAEPYIFKSLFSKESLTFKDFCQVRSVTSQMYLDMNENLPDHYATKEDVDEWLFNNPEPEKGSDEKKYERDYKKWENFMIHEGDLIESHNYIFVGSTGSFVPVKEGAGGGVLYRADGIKGKKYAVGGSKGYRWMESEKVKELGKEDDIDISYFITLADKAVADIEEYGDFNWFVSPEPYSFTIPIDTIPGDDFTNVISSEEDVF